MKKSMYNTVQCQLNELISKYPVLSSNRREAYRSGVRACKSMLSDCFSKGSVEFLRSRLYHKLGHNRYLGDYKEDYLRGIKDSIIVVERAFVSSKDLEDMRYVKMWGLW